MGPLGAGLLEAAQDLGAGARTLWRRVIIPLTAAPATSAFLFVFILSASDYVTPQFLGGTKGATLGVQVQVNFITLGDWPLAAATSFLMLAAFGLCYLLSAVVLRVLRLHDIRFVN
jgi:spermidine/putrescine transport system permease protein